MNKGFDEDTAMETIAPQCKSTLAVYDRLWNQFYDYAEEQGFDPFYPSIPQIAAFLHKKFVDGASSRSIGGFRAAIDATLRHHTKLKVGRNQQLSDQCKCYRIQKP